ncbi:MAG: hypothetical protein U0228_23115 [Myxococcaceae bacterium]
MRSWGVVLLLCGCSQGAIDVTFVSTPPAQLTSLTIDATSAGESRHAQLGDGGVISLPFTARLVAQSAVELDVVGFDTDGNTRLQHASIPLSPGKATTFEVDLSRASACPAPPPNAGESVVFAEASDVGSLFNPFGYDGCSNSGDCIGGGVCSGGACQPSRATQVMSTPCTGALVNEYTVVRQYDGFGFALADGSNRKFRHVSFRMQASQNSQWLVFLARSGQSAVLPRPASCTNSAPGDCLMPFGAEWTHVELDVPASVGDFNSVQFQIYSPVGARFTVRVDDVRVTF